MSNKTGTSGIGVLGALQVVLIVLKALGIINWPWLLVLFPIWIEIVLVVLFLVFFTIIYVIALAIGELDK